MTFKREEHDSTISDQKVLKTHNHMRQFNRQKTATSRGILSQTMRSLQHTDQLYSFGDNTSDYQHGLEMTKSKLKFY